jgi:hypothetical protein
VRAVRAQAERLKTDGIRTQGIVLAKHVMHSGTDDGRRTSFKILVRLDATRPSGEQTGVVKEFLVDSVT